MCSDLDGDNQCHLKFKVLEWFQNVKEIAIKFNFCADNKLYKEDPSKRSGNINDACEIIRLAIVGRKVTPNLFAIMKILPKEEIDFIESHVKEME